MPNMLLVNPSPARGRKRRVKSRRRKAYKVIAAAKRSKGRKRNPAPAVVFPRRSKYQRRSFAGSRSAGGIVNQQVIPAAIGAGGALALDVAMGVVGKKLPASLSAGPARHLVKGGVAVAIGILASKVSNAHTARQVATGALTVIMHEAARELIAKTGIPLGDESYMGEYLGEDDGMGYFNPAELAEDDGMGAYLEAISDDSLMDGMPIGDEAFADVGEYD